MIDSEGLEKLRKVGVISGEAREYGMSLCEPGAKLYEIAQETEGYIRKHGCGLSFPCNISRNDEAAHYTPSCTDETKLEVGDVVKIDCGGMLDGYIGDTAGTVEVGTHDYTNLIAASKKARDTVGEFIGDGVKICEIGAVIEQTVKAAGFKVVENLCGHQIDRYELHAGFSVPPYDAGDQTKIETGMTVAIEPFATNGGGYVVNGKWGNIVQVTNDKKTGNEEADNFLEYVKKEFPDSPFCARSCDYDHAEKWVRFLMRKGVLSGFNILKEVDKGMVSQFEYTFYIAGKRAEITTSP
jgi:methionyl aminopeptidase